MFASKNAHNFSKISRRDDLISLVYLLIYLLDVGRLNFIDYCRDNENIEIVGKIKSKMGCSELCGNSMEESRAYSIKEFVIEAMSYEFTDEPNYDKLRFLL